MTNTKAQGFGRLVGFLTSSSTTRLYRGRAPRQSVWQFYVLPHMRQSWETMTSISAGHIILTPTQPVGSGRPQRRSNPVPPDQETRALPTELPRPPKEVLFEISAGHWINLYSAIISIRNVHTHTKIENCKNIFRTDSHMEFNKFNQINTYSSWVISSLTSWWMVNSLILRSFKMCTLKLKLKKMNASKD